MKASSFRKIIHPHHLILLALLIPCSLYSQTISGKIKNSDGEKLLLANVVIKDSLYDNAIREFVIARNGEYAITLKGNYQAIIIEVSANKYRKEFFEIRDLAKSQSYIHDFILQKDKTDQLKEVIVSAKARPFQINGDTVKYNVSAYRDGSERKIEDLIKKLPGIEVNEKTGEITYKGKAVETVNLGGDNLFGSNYAIGTRNINVDMIEQVQAIENYSDNPLLKGIESGEKVALNLVLKKRKMDFSADADFGNGISQEGRSVSNIGADVLGVSKNYKSFGVFSYNNVGVNNTPFDYFSYNPNAEQIKETDFLAKKIIPETIFSSALDDGRANINNAWFVNHNNIFKIGNRLSIKTNAYYINDRITSKQEFSNHNFINNQQLSTSDNYDFQKKPVQYRGDLEMKYNPSKNSLMEYKLRISRQDICTKTNILQNDSTNYQTNLSTEDFNFKQSLQFTQKVSDKNVLQLLFNQSSNNIPENYSLNPSVYDPMIYTSNNQFAHFKKNMINVQSVFLGATKKTRYSFSLNGNIGKTPFYSRLSGIDHGADYMINGFTNDFNYQKASIYTSGAYHINFGKWKISPSYYLSYLEQNLRSSSEKSISKRNDLIFEPAFSITRKLNNVSGITGTVSYNQKPFSEEYLFYNPVYISNREAIKNTPILEFQKITFFRILYFINNLYKQFQLQLGLGYYKKQGDFFSDINIYEDSTRTQYFYLPKSNDNINLNFLIEKYIPLFQSTVRLKSNYSIQNYKNVINGSGLRNNNNQFFSSELFLKTAFNYKINFENIIRYQKNKYQSENAVSFANETVHNTFKVIVKPVSSWFILLSSDYFLPNIKETSKNYLFLDGVLRFVPKNKLFEVNFTAKNILGNKMFTQIETTDFSTNSFRSNLIPGYFMVSLSHHF